MPTPKSHSANGTTSNHQLRGTDTSGDLAFDQNTDDTERDQLQPDRDDLVVGMGFNGQLNSFKWYDWSSAPVATFADGTVSTTVTLKDDTGSMPVEIVSTGNLRQGSSQLNLQRIAIHTDKVRQYGTLISAQTFGQIAEQYTDTLSTTAPPINPDGLLASYSKNNQGYYVNTFAGGGTGLPLSSVMPQAHAGFADFAWGLVDFLLPIESIKEVVVQLSYLVTDPDKFEMDIFIVSAVDVLTIFPVAKPLKLFTTPLKAMMRFMPKKMRPHFARALKQVMNRAKKGDFDVLWNLLPFMVLTAEMMSDEEMRKGLEFMFSTVNSAEDMLSWVDYLALPAGGWEGDELPEIDPFSSAPDTAALPLSFVVGQAYANKKKGFRVPTAALGAALIKASKRIAKGNADNLPQGLAELTKTLKSGKGKAFRKYVFNPSLLAVSGGFAARQGIRNIKNFLTGRTNSRYSAPTILAITAFTEWQLACGKALDQKAGIDVTDPISPPEAIDEVLETLTCQGKGITGKQNRLMVYKKIYLPAFGNILIGNIKGGAHGALFHLAQLTRYQLAHLVGGQPVKAIDGYRRIWLYRNEQGVEEGKSILDEKKQSPHIVRKYDRHVDLVIGYEDGEEQWIELKSYAAKSRKERHVIEYLASKKKKERYITRWDLGTGKSGGENLHKQFSLDRSAAYVTHARVPSGRPNQRKGITVSPDFLWLFQKFDVKWKDSKGVQRESVSVDPGPPSGKLNTIRKAMAKPIAGGNKGESDRELYVANMGEFIDTRNHVKESNVKQLLESLVAAKFSEAKDALELISAE